MRLGHLAIVLFSLIGNAVGADEKPATAGLAERIASIEQAHVHAPWPVSQQMIDELRPILVDATSDQRARVAIMEARNFILDGRYGRALQLLDNLLAQPIELTRRLRALELAVNANYLSQDYERAFALLAQALALFPESDDLKQKADVLTLASRLHSDIGEHGFALESAAESLEMANRTAHARTIYNSLYSLVLVQKNAGFPQFALERSQELWEHSQQSEDPVSVGSAMSLIGSVYTAAGRYKEATGWLRRAIDKNLETGYLNGVFEARKELGIALVETGQEAQGLSMLVELVSEFERRENWQDLMQIHQVMSTVHERRERYDQALTYLDRYREAAGKYRNEQRARRLAYLQAEFENQRRNQELELLRQENLVLAKREDTIKARRSVRMLGGTMLLIIGLLLTGLLLRFRADRHRFRRMSEIDGLTGLYNHRRFHHAVEDSLAENRERGRVCSLVAADVDLFKQINDRYGHQAGDQVLRKLGALLLEHFPAPCIVGRIGGEEFAIFLPGHNRLQAHQRIREFRDGIRPIEFNGHSIEVTLSFGLLESRRASRLESMRARADQALYKAKRSGRNQMIDAANMSAF
ncbi:MAG TPA: GGDEF domain-containing protein [Wenzhouxiangellaceae bacterium]|nr:GGDEF domain-containing protein [Wenzhouxiangellaceae bacterium]